MKNVMPFLEHIAYDMRRLSIEMTTKAGSGHATSALSAADIMTVYFFMRCTMIQQILTTQTMIVLFYQRGMRCPFYTQHGKKLGGFQSKICFHIVHLLLL